MKSGYIKENGQTLLPITHEFLVLDNNGISMPDKYATKEDLNTKAEKIHTHTEYLTNHQDISHLAIKSEVNAQFNTVAKKDEIWTMANMGQDVKESMTNGSVAVVGNHGVLNQNIVPKQITNDKLADNVFKFKESNLITEVFEGGFVNWFDGSIQLSDVYCYSNYISVHGYSKIYGRCNYHYAFYDSNLAFVSGNQGYPNGVQPIEIIVPDNAEFIRVSIQKATRVNFVLGTSLEFVSYKGSKNILVLPSTTINGESIVLEDDFISTNNLKNNCVTREKTDNSIVKCSLGKNKYYVESPSTSVNWDTGSLIENELYDTSAYIPVNEGDIINQTIKAHYCLYDKYFNRIEGYRDTNYVAPIVIPTNGAYIRVSPHKINNQNYMLTINEELGEYERARYILDSINNIPVEQENQCNKTKESRFEGKKVSWYGTSITQGYGWCNLVNNYFNFSATNNGVGGTTISRENNDSSMCTKNRMQGLYGGVYDENTGQTTYNGVAIPSDVEVIFIEGGTNDWARNWAIGDKTFVESPNDKTFAGACHTMFKNLTELFPNAEIIVLGSPFGKMPNRDVFTNKYGILNNNNLQTLEYGDILLDVAGKWGIKGINIGRLMQVHDNNITTLIPDGLHLTTTEVQKMASDVIINYLLSLN